MRKILLLSFVLVAAFMQAQITITTENIGGPGGIFVMGNDEEASGQINLGNPGANQTWDFSMLDNDDADTICFHEPQDYPFWEDYPEANLLIEMDMDSNYAYAKNTDENFNIQGLVVRNDMTGLISLPMDPPLIIIDFPMNYQDTLEQETEQITVFESPDPPADSIKIEIINEETRMVDAWGSLQLPWFTFDVLRVDDQLISNTTVYAKIFGNWSIVSETVDTSYSYEFWTNHPNIGYLLCDIDYDPQSGDIENVQYMSEFAIYVGLQENIEHSDLSVFPNPAVDILNIDFGKYFTGTIDLYDLSGKRIITRQFENVDNIEIDIADVGKGVYICKVHDKKNAAVFSDRIIKK